MQSFFKKESERNGSSEGIYNPPSEASPCFIAWAPVVATFFERVGAYLLDMIIISFIFSLISLGFGNYTSSTEKLMEELDNKLLASEVTPEEYLEEYKDLFILQC